MITFEGFLKLLTFDTQSFCEQKNSQMSNRKPLTTIIN